MADVLSLASGAAEHAADPRPRLTVSVIGGVRLSYGDRDIDLRNRKARAMVAYLALSETGEERRERLAGLLWSEFSEQNARATLRQCVHETREAMVAAGCPPLNGGRLTVSLAPGSFHVDILDALEAAGQYEVPNALLGEKRLAETLLAGFEDLDGAFHAWLTGRRQLLHDSLVRSLESGYRDQQLPRLRRRRLAHATLLLDPTHEEACRVVMRCAAEDGEIGAALRAYEELYRLLDEDYDQEPSILTQELVAEVKQGRFDGIPAEAEPEEASPLSFAAALQQALVSPRRAVAPPPPAPVPPKPALYIEDFAISGVPPDQVHLVTGFRVELLACLTRFREWYVSGTQELDIGDHGGVPVSARYALTTTAYQAGFAINVVMVLQERPSGLAIWGERFELRLDSWAAMQQRIVRRLASTLNVQISTERLVRSASLPEGSLKAYDVWLRSQMILSCWAPGEWNRAALQLGVAIEQAPTFSPLYSSLAQMNNVVHIVQPGIFRSEEKAQRTLALAQRAVSLDPRDSRAELCLGWALAFCRRYTQAELHMEIACELNGNDSWTLMSAAMFHAFNGNAERARELSVISMETTLSPTPNQWVYLASIRYLLGDDEAALVAADRSQDALLTVSAWRAAALAGLGRTAEAQRDAGRFIASARAAWSGDVPATEAMIVKWMLSIFPVGKAVVWNRMRDGLAAAGLPVTGLTYQG